MAQINNSTVIQKLVDELNLQAGSDIIPNQTADKIIPTFQINDQAVEVSTEPATVVSSNSVIATNNTKSVYSVPATGKFYLTNITLSSAVFQNQTTGTGWSDYVEVTPKGGTAQKILRVQLSHVANIGSELPGFASLNLQNPLILEPGTEIEVTSSAGQSGAWSTIIGYTSD